MSSFSTVVGSDHLYGDEKYNSICNKRKYNLIISVIAEIFVL